MYPGKRFRLQPPWPPGLGTLKRALLGPERYRSASAPGQVMRAYDDSVLIALALNAFFQSAPAGFSIAAPGFMLDCAVDARLAPDQLRALLRRVAEGAPASEEDIYSGCMEAGIEIRAQVDGIDIAYRAWMAERSRQKGARWNPSVLKALALMQEHAETQMQY